MTQWTQEQLRAIEARGSHILLSAAAGSGKTTVLVERVLRLITDAGVDVDRMLVVTFTRAAASDMRAKLAARLNERAAAGDARCREQLFKLDRATITTLHAFCSDFLRTNFETAGVDPAFRILADAVADRLWQEALDEALEAAYSGAAESDGSTAQEDPDDGTPAQAHPGEALLALDYGRGPSGVRAAVEALLFHMEARPDPAAWLDSACDCGEARLSQWQDELKGAARRSIGSAIVQLRQAMAVPGCPAHYEDAVRKDVAVLYDMLALEDYDDISRAVAGFKPTAARGRRTEGDEEAVEAVKRLRDSAKRSVQGARIAQLPLLTAREDAARLSGQLRTLADIALDASGRFEAAKAEQAGLTYADLEHRTLRALKDPGAAAQQRARFDYIFVDEYQDTSDIQEALIRAICRDDNLFMVGDVKQSIYRFRLAEPRLFLEKYAAYAHGEGGMLLPLTRNFRSRRGILDFVNMVFERAMTGGDSEIVYDDMARLRPGDPDEDEADVPDVDIRLIDSAAEAEAADEAIAEMGAAEREGLLIAGIIRQMMAEDDSLRYRDFAILTRSKAAPFASMMPVLLAAGIPAYADGATGYFESVEITWMLSMLRLIANGRSDIELIGALRSPAAGLDAVALARIRIRCPDMPFCDAAARYAACEDDALSERLRGFFAMVEGFRLRAGGMGLGELTRLVLDETGFYTYAGALPGGAQRQANLDQFVISAGSFDREQSGALTRFLRYTEHMRARGDGDAAHLLSEADDVVRMMTIHKSKGLEFRVVFGAQAARRYKVENTGTALLAHRDLGMGMSYVDPLLRSRRQTLSQAAIIERGRREDSAEELRILYVLLTRAREKLVLVGTVKDIQRSWKHWQALSAAPFAAGSHLDVVMAARCGAESEGQALHSTLRVIAAAELQPEAQQTGAMDAARRLEAIRSRPDAFCDDAMDRQLNWRYPDPDAAKRPLKLTASGLLRELEGPEEVPVLAERPRFLAEDVRRMTGAERGTAYHRAMQLVALEPLAGLSGPALIRALKAQLDDMAERRLMTDVQRDAVSESVLARFLSGPVGTRLRAAETVRREWSFNAMLRASEALTPEEAARYGDVELLVQGTIDCCFIEDGRWILLDYKTDRTDDVELLKAHYARQLRLYALALQRITGIPVAERVLCLIGQDRVLDLTETDN